MINLLFPNIKTTSNKVFCNDGIQYHFFLCQNYQLNFNQETKYNVYFYQDCIYMSDITNIKRHVYLFQINNDSFLNLEKNTSNNNEGLVNMMFIPSKTNLNNYSFHLDIKDEFILILVIECMSNYLKLEGSERQKFKAYIEQCVAYVTKKEINSTN